MRSFKVLLLAAIVTAMVGSQFSSQAVTVNGASNPYDEYFTYNGVTWSNCTWWAWQRWHEVNGEALPNWHNAGQWETNAAGSYTVDNTPQRHSIAVFPWYFGGVGHVAFVEDVATEADGRVKSYISERGRSNDGVKPYLPTHYRWVYNESRIQYIHPNTPPPSANVDVMLIIDSSGSMSGNDPGYKRRDAARAYLNPSRSGDHVGVVDFDSTARLASGLLPAKIGNQANQNLIDAINTIDSSGSTNIRDGISVGCQELADNGSAVKRGAILLTDGQHNEGAFGNPQQCFEDRGWPIFTFGFGSANDTLLSTIATDTGGEFKRIADVASLVCEFQRVRTLIAGEQPGPCTARGVLPGQTTSLAQAIPPTQAQVTFSSSWLGSDIVMTLIAPSGRTITRDSSDPDVTHDQGPTFEVYTIAYPEAGEWIIELFGADVPAEGEDTIIGVTTISAPDADGDGIADELDNCSAVANAEQADADADDVGNACDNCPNTANPDQADGDSDAVGNVCDNCPATANADQADGDGDGVGNVCDNCPSKANADQADGDGDSVGNVCDNCPQTANPDQADGDNDVVGDVCDNCPQTANADQADGDNDDVGNVCDNCPIVSNPSQADSDSDGVGNACEPVDTPTPSPTPSPTPTRTPTPTPTPTALPSMITPLAAGWNDKCYVGEQKGVEEALAGIADKVLAVYILNSAQEWDRWFPARTDISTITTLTPYDQLFVVMSADANWVQEESPAGQASVSLIEGWNSVCYTGQQKAVADATSSIAGKFSILYTFADDQAWARYVPGRSDLSDITQLKPYDPLLVLVTAASGEQWIFDQ